MHAREILGKSSLRIHWWSGYRAATIPRCEHVRRTSSAEEASVHVRRFTRVRRGVRRRAREGESPAEKRASLCFFKSDATLGPLMRLVLVIVLLSRAFPLFHLSALSFPFRAQIRNHDI